MHRGKKRLSYTLLTYNCLKAFNAINFIVLCDCACFLFHKKVRIRQLVHKAYDVGVKTS